MAEENKGYLVQVVVSGGIEMLMNEMGRRGVVGYI